MTILLDKDLRQKSTFVLDAGKTGSFESILMSCRVVDGIEDNEPAFHFNVEPSEVTSNRRAKGKSPFCLELDRISVLPCVLIR